MASPKPSRSNGFVPDIKEGSVHNTRAKSREGSDSNVSFKDDWSKENILNVNYLSPRKNLQRATESRGSCESGVSVKSDRLRDFISDVKDRSPLKMAEREAQRDKEIAINHECSPTRSRRPILIIQERSSHKSLVEESPSTGISCASVKRDNSQGHIANVKDTLPAPKNKSDFSIFQEEEDSVSDDEDLVESSDDQRATGSMKSFDSGLSLQSDQSKAGMILFKDSSPLSRSDFSCFEEDALSDDEDWTTSSDDQDEMNQELSSEVG